MIHEYDIAQYHPVILNLKCVVLGTDQVLCREESAAIAPPRRGREFVCEEHGLQALSGAAAHPPPKISGARTGEVQCETSSPRSTRSSIRQRPIASWVAPPES